MDNSCWVYVFAQNTVDGPSAPVKVGISNNPNSRLASIQTSCPFKIEMAYIFECPTREIAEYIERCFHETQTEKCLHGEWFDFTPVEAIHLLCLAFRASLEARLADKSLIEPSLDVCGVLWAERRFNLHVPDTLQ